VSASRDGRDALQRDRFEQIFSMSVWKATWFVVRPS
jgi:hypothetical protein